jgi:hypothetical protein
MSVIRLECDRCGSDRCRTTGMSADDAWIVCERCGEKLITYLTLHQEIARQAQIYATKSIESCFGTFPTRDAIIVCDRSNVVPSPR